MAVSASEARREYKKRWRQENRARVNEYAREWRSRNPEKVREYQAKYWQRVAQEGSNEE